jgi:hypothetical protein
MCSCLRQKPLRWMRGRKGKNRQPVVIQTATSTSILVCHPDTSVAHSTHSCDGINGEENHCEVPVAAMMPPSLDLNTSQSQKSHGRWGREAIWNCHFFSISWGLPVHETGAPICSSQYQCFQGELSLDLSSPHMTIKTARRDREGGWQALVNPWEDHKPTALQLSIPSHLFSSPPHDLYGDKCIPRSFWSFSPPCTEHSPTREVLC